MPERRSSGTIEVRAGKDPDLAAVARLHRASILSECGSHYTATQLSTWTKRLTLEAYRALVAPRKWYVATIDRRICGFGIVDTNAALINATYVAPERIGMGAGRVLVEAMQTLAVEHGLRRLSLVSTLNAVGFYEHLGFIQDAQMDGSSPGGEDLPGVTMSKSL